MKLIHGQELTNRLQASPPLIENLRDPETQIQMNGVDFTLREVAAFDDQPGAIDFDNSESTHPRYESHRAQRGRVVAPRAWLVLGGL